MGKVITAGNGNGYGDGNGYGYGDGNGNGYGDGNGNGYGDGNGNGNGVVLVSEETPIVAYHYVPRDGCIRHEHGGQIPKIEVGLVLEWVGDLELCRRGLHASLTPEDARSYCDGILTKVVCSGQIKFAEDKLVCSRREILEIYDQDPESIK